MSRDQSYGERLLAVIKEQMEVREIDPDDFDDVCAQIAESYDIDALTSMHGGQLRHVQQHLDAHLRKYLGGPKRASGDGSLAWPETATSAAIMEAAKAGILLSEIEGTGKDGVITKGDVVTITADDVGSAEEELGL